MTNTQIDCKDCGRETSAQNAHAKYCPLCRLLSNLLFLKTRKHKCMLCDQRYAPIDRNDVICNGCHPLRRWHNVDGTCTLCNTETHLWSEDVHVCMNCAQDPDQRPLLVKALVKKQTVLTRVVSV